MKQLITSCLLLVFLHGGIITAGELPVLKPGGVTRGNPEEILPAGAVLHLRANNIAALLDTLDSLITTFVPRKALPPNLEPIMNEPKPVLAFLGMELMGGGPLSAEKLGVLFGIAVERPITLSLYAEDKDKGFVVSLPMANPQAITGFLMKVFRTTKFDAIKLGNGEGYSIAVRNRDLPRRVFVVCSEDTVYVCGTRDRAAELTLGLKEGRLNAGPIVSRELSFFKKDSFSAVVDTAVIRQMIAAGKDRFAELPPHVMMEVMKARDRMSADERRRLDLRLKVHHGINGVDELIDYFECIAAGSYRVLYSYLTTEALAFEGIVLSLAPGKSLHRGALRVYSKSIKAADYKQPLPANEVSKVIDSLPVSANAISACGRAPAIKASPVLLRWIAEIRKDFAKKGLSLKAIDLVSRYLASRSFTTSIESKVPWKAYAASLPDSRIPPGLDSLKKYQEYMSRRLLKEKLVIPFTVVPKQPASFFKQFFADVAGAATRDAANYEKLVSELTGGQKWYNYSCRFKSSPVANGIEQYVIEDVYQTSAGIWGYTQHELINRRMIHVRTIGQYSYLLESGDPTPLTMIKDGATKGLPEGFRKLFAEMPANANSITMGRSLNLLLDIAAHLTTLEKIAHREVDSYLVAAQKAFADNPDNLDAALEALSNTDVPLPLLSLNLDPLEKKVYCTLVGDLKYPRPLVMPLVNELLAGYSEKSDAVGGGAIFTRVTDGMYECSIVQSTEALSLLVRTAVNTFFEKYMLQPEGLGKLMQKVMVPGDGEEKTDQRIFVNPTWEVLMRELGN